MLHQINKKTKHLQDTQKEEGLDETSNSEGVLTRATLVDFRPSYSKHPKKA